MQAPALYSYLHSREMNEGWPKSRRTRKSRHKDKVFADVLLWGLGG